MLTEITNEDIDFIRQAIKLAEEAERSRNLPIGALITLDGKIIAKGKNSIWKPEYRPGRHAEIETIEAVDFRYWSSAASMTLYTTLEPCLMCLGTILVHRIGRVVYGAKDKHGGASCVLSYMPDAFKALKQSTKWDGPALPEECDKLSRRVIHLAVWHRRQQGRSSSLWDSCIEEKSQIED